MLPARRATRASPAPPRRSPGLPYMAPLSTTAVSTPSTVPSLRLTADRARLAGRVPPNGLLRRQAGRVVLLVGGRDDVELDAKLLEDRPPLRRRRGEKRAAGPRQATCFRDHPDLLRRPAARPVERDQSRLARIAVLRRLELEQSRSTSKPFRCSRRIHSPCGRWNSTAVVVGPLDPSHAELVAQRAGRRPAPSSGVAERRRACEFVRKIERPPGRSSRAASGIQRSGSHQRRRAVLGEREVEGRVGQRHLLGRRLDEGELEPVLLLQAPRGLELGCGVVEPDHPSAAAGEPGRPVRRPAAELDRRPCLRRRASTRSSAPGCSRCPRMGSCCRPGALPERRPSSRIRVPARAVAAACSVSRQTSSSSENQSAISLAADSGESEPWTRLSGIASAIVAADRSRGGLDRVRRPHRGAHHLDRGVAFENERQRRRRGDELRELSEERLLTVLGVVLVRQLAVEPRAASRRRASSPAARSGR